MSTDSPLDWALSQAEGPGEEGERTLWVDVDDSVGIQVWDDVTEQDDHPIIGVWARDLGHSEVQFYLPPDEALVLAANLIVHAENARQKAIARALWEGE